MKVSAVAPSLNSRRGMDTRFRTLRQSRTGLASVGAVGRYHSVFEIVIYHPRESPRPTESVTPPRPLEAMAHRNASIACDVCSHCRLERTADPGARSQAGDPASLDTAIPDLTGSSELQDQFKENGVTCGRRERNRRRGVAMSVATYTAALHSSRPFRSPARPW